MPPRPALLQNFGLTYRKIPVLAIGRDIYCDTSLIIEALEHFFPIKDGWGTVYPACEGIEEWVYKGMARGFASFWTDVHPLSRLERRRTNTPPAPPLPRHNRPHPTLRLALLLRHRPCPTHRPRPRR